MKSGEKYFNWGKRTYLMGVVNVTPDSFSGDGTIAIGDTESQWVTAAVDQALRMEDEGADVIDIGGESTRPPSVYKDAHSIGSEEECGRVLPVIDALRTRLDVPISIDTRNADVAMAATKTGASMINDVSMLGDPEMTATAATSGAALIISHIRPKAEYIDPVADVASDLESAVGLAESVTDSAPSKGASQVPVRAPVAASASIAPAQARPRKPSFSPIEPVSITASTMINAHRTSTAETALGLVIMLQVSSNMGLLGDAPGPPIRQEKPDLLFSCPASGAGRPARNQSSSGPGTGTSAAPRRC